MLVIALTIARSESRNKPTHSDTIGNLLFLLFLSLPWDLSLWTYVHPRLCFDPESNYLVVVEEKLIPVCGLPCVAALLDVTDLRVS